MTGPPVASWICTSTPTAGSPGASPVNLTTRPLTVIVEGCGVGSTVMVAEAVSVPAVAVRVTVVDDASLAGGVYVVVVPLAESIVPTAGASDQEIASLLFWRVAVKSCVAPPAVTVAFVGVTSRVGSGTVPDVCEPEP